MCLRLTLQFKGIPRFYDIGGFLKNPEIFQLIVDIFVDRYKALEIDSVCGLDARGFVLGPPIALAMKKVWPRHNYNTHTRACARTYAHTQVDTHTDT